MAREYGQIKTTIWSNPDYLDLTVHEQWLYLHLVTHPALSWCGVTDWRPRHIVPKASGQRLDDIELAANVLTHKRFIVIDEDTEEVLVRSYLRNDGILRKGNMAKAAAKAYTSVASRTLAGVIVHELRRLHAETKRDPKMAATWQALSDILEHPAIDPATLPPYVQDVPVLGEPETAEAPF